MLMAMMMQRFATMQMHNSQYAMMQNHANQMAMCRNLPNFRGGMSAIQAIDTRMAINNAHNQTMYMIASAQKQACDKMLANELKNHKISYIA